MTAAIPDVLALLHTKPDLTSIFCLIVFSIVFLVLAYLTNPSENSFRAYLTEQSFRHHLSRLDDNADDNLATHPSPSSSSVNQTASAADKAPSFHFANRASISLRTPKHVFHSFAVFTIAAMLPISKGPDAQSRDGWIISDSWYIGAFGKWWRGGAFEEWYQDILSRKDEESWSSGILGMKRLDMLQDYNAPTFSAKNLPAHLAPGSPPRLRNRERPTLRNAAIHPRSSTPPPLPKSASLPMHTVRNGGGSRIGDSAHARAQPHGQPCINTDNAPRVSAPPSRTSSALFEQSPLITEVLRQITNAKASVVDLRTQLTECQTSASQSRDVLEHEVDTYRDRKRQDDSLKAELKSRTKALEDSKRTAEGLKKDADKKLRSAHTIRDNAAQRMEFLDGRILHFKDQLVEDRKFISSHRSQVSEEEREMTASLDEKRLEVKATEDHVHALNQRSRDLEDKLASGRERLRILREKTDDYKQRRSLPLDPQQTLYDSQDAWISGHGQAASPLAASPLQTEHWNMKPEGQHRQNSAYDHPTFPTSAINLPADIHTAAMFNGTSFSPFEDSPMLPNNTQIVIDKSGTSAPYFTGLGLPLDEDATFKSDSDPYVDNKHWAASYANVTDDPRLTSPITLRGASITNSSEIMADVPSFGNYGFNDGQHRVIPTDKHWYSGLTRSNKRLNPDAKEFNLFTKPNNLFGNGNGHSASNAMVAATSFDALNPNGFASATTTTSHSLLRAFAPSPAEREALQRALGGSSNTSFERLPSLTDVGSIPASPTNPHAHPSHLPPSPAAGRDLGSLLPVWLQSLPRTRKANFSPWDDEEPSTCSARES